MGKPLDITSQRQMTPHVSKWLHWHPPWLSDAGTPRKDPESQRLAEDSQERNPITIKPKTVSHVAQQSSWVLLLPSSWGVPLPIKSLAWSAQVSPGTIHFQVLDKSPLLGPGRGPASCNIRTGKGQFSFQSQRRVMPKMFKKVSHTVMSGSLQSHGL